MMLQNQKKIYKHFPFLSVLLSIPLYLILKGNFTIYTIFIFSLILFLNLLPIYMYLLNYRNVDDIPLFELTHIYFFLSYTLAIIFDQIEFSITNFNLLDESGENLSFAIKIFFLGILCFNLGYLLVIKFIEKKNYFRVEIFDFKKNNEFLIIVGLGFYLFYIISFYYLKDLEIIRKVNQLEFLSLYFSIGCIFLYLLLKKNLNILIKITLILLIINLIYISVLKGLMVAPALIVIFLYILNFIFTKKFNFKFLLIFLVVFIFLNIFKDIYRTNTWWQPSENVENNKLKIFINSYKKGVIKFNNENINENSRLILQVFKRGFHSFNSLILVTNKTPDEIPYLDGKSYNTLLTKPIPRIIWKEKPQELFGNQFGHIYKVLNKSDMSTSWNMPVLNEFYANFGLIGVVLGMFLLGIFFGLIKRILSFDKENFLFLISLVAIYPMFYLEINLSNLIGITIQKFLFLFIVVYLIKKIFNFLKIYK